MDKKNKIMAIIILSFLTLVAIGTTFAYFSAVINGSESESTIVVTGGEMSIVYADLTNKIEVFGISPREEAWAVKDFTVTAKNTTIDDLKYYIILEVDNNTFTKDALTYRLTSENTSNNGEVASFIENKNIDKSQKIGVGFFTKGENLVHTYKFELFFKEKYISQDENQEASFSARIVIKAYKPPKDLELTLANLEYIGYENNVVPSSLIIPDDVYYNGDVYSVKTIGQGAFQNSRMLSLELNEGLEEIGDSAFASSYLKTSITMPSTVKTIGSSAFSSSGITDIILNDGLETIGSSAFSGTTYLKTSITVPSSVKTIGSSAFNSSSITGLILNEGLETIGNNAFSHTTYLKTSITVPSSVKTIGSSAFSSSSITSIILNEGLESIGSSAFQQTSNLTGTITIPGTIKTIGTNAFNNSGITGLILNEGIETISSRAFNYARNLTGSLTLPSTVKSVGTGAFSSTKISSLILYKGVEKIESSAFNMSTLTDVYYTGTEDEWNQISLGTNAIRSSATIHYNHVIE